MTAPILIIIFALICAGLLAVEAHIGSSSKSRGARKAVNRRLALSQERR